ncbi:3-oxoacyl-ACP reductase [Niveispirillum lacus]|uniref:3-oxoacyl-ACP reductase n=1 Tax=Niveispirillum lacus TaxID=1981099 RepID=A0A255YSF2_9PROT|nr:SDR family NAD(P)-dependent oxidoreductase [Niveispirillum lacus]OYQ31380.1 3-oxoacyl-ACP reductase [Niveispirillum lacus]
MSVYADRFKGQVAIVTGGASGVGREVAARLTQEGAKVVLWDMNADALAEAKAATGAVDAVALDVTDAEAVHAAADAVAQKLGRLDVLVASAGITGATVPVQDFPLDSWRRVIDINLNGLFYCCRAVIPHMLKNDYGRIVNVSSVAGKEGNPNASAYSASKAGVIGFTKSLGKELAKTGIRVNALTPATFKSPILDQLPQSQVDYMLSKIPAGRLGEVHEVAAMISWMASAECSFTTASTFDISGGRTTY